MGRDQGLTHLVIGGKMATYTDNYQFTKPTYAEVADVQTFNNNMTKIDEILHASQVSLAPAYDPTQTYNAGDVVMYELLMYECQEDAVTGVWDPTKWGRTTAGEHGGGSDVEPDPTGEPTATLTKLGIEGTIYGIEGSGGGNVYGAFIDTSRIITTLTGSGSGTDFQNYTATEDCAVVGTIKGNSAAVQINGVTTDYTSVTNETIGVCVLAKKGQVVSYQMTSDSTLTVYGLTFGTQNIFTPQIYSLEEREVGVWIDNKPLYAKTYPVTFTGSYVDISINSTHEIKMLDGGVDSLNNDNFIHIGYGTSSNDMCGVYEYELGKLRFQNFYYQSCPNGWLTTFYTKTTDTAGSGSFNTLGVPMVHYSTEEQVIGTFEDENSIIKPLYQKMVRFTNIAKNGDIPFGVTGGENYMLITGKLSESITLPYIHGSAPSNNIGGFFDGDKWSLRSGADAPSTVSGFIIIQYTKTTD